MIAASIFLLYLAGFPVALQAGQWVRVKVVIDGDTLLLSDGRFVRYIGINSPEIAHPDKPGEPFGEAATRCNAELVGAGRVQLEFDRQKHDHYGRLLAYVYTEKGVMVNRAMIAAGMAYCLYKAPNLRYTRELLDAQITAMNAARGFWTQLGRTAGRVIGNKHSRRFHRLDCRNALKMSPKNKTQFATQWQAFLKGYAPGKNCLGGMPLP